MKLTECLKDYLQSGKILLPKDSNFKLQGRKQVKFERATGGLPNGRNIPYFIHAPLDLLNSINGFENTNIKHRKGISADYRPAHEYHITVPMTGRLEERDAPLHKKRKLSAFITMSRPPSIPLPSATSHGISVSHYIFNDCTLGATDPRK